MSLSENQTPEIRLSFADDAVLKQRRQMLIALTLLLVALVMVLTKDREFWFPSAPVFQSTSEPMEETSSEPQAQSEAVTSPKQTTGISTLKAKQQKPVTSAGPGQASAAAPVVMSRTVLPPLEVEVVAGDQHRTIQAGSNSVQLDIRTPSTSSPAVRIPPASDTAAVTAAGTRVHLSPSATQTLSRPVEPNYPLLAREMRIQGAVVLEVLIGREGIIQHLRVLSGPAILSAAAQEAVKQWHFRPYLLAGQPVETEARITVNFTIFTQ
jgi:TonB family protein